MKIELEQHAAASVVRPVGRLDNVSSGKLEKLVLEQIDRGARHLILDFSRLTYISSAGLRVVLLAGKRLKAGAGTLHLCALNPQVKDVFGISGFAAMFPIHDDLAAALTAARPAGTAGD